VELRISLLEANPKFLSSHVSGEDMKDSSPTEQVASPVTVLYVRPDSVYKTMPGVDAWDAERDARKWIGGGPVVAHPPCRGWGRLRQFSYADEAERTLAIKAVLEVQMWGGALEHPAESSLWAHMGLPRPGQAPRKGGYTIEVDQWRWGHRAEKRTWLYIVGCNPDDLPPIPEREGRPTHCVRSTKAYPRLPSITKPEREQTPPAFAEWLVELARRCA
jgi:hypothetical protein